MRDEVIESGNINWNSIVIELTGPIPKGKSIWYQKHMAQHNLPGCDLGWVHKLSNCILIRHPKDVILSYLEKYKIDSEDQLGYDQQLELFNLLTELNIPLLVIDATDILINPRSMLMLICEKLGIPFFKEMLSWSSGRRKNDGIWGKHWYRSVETSTGFQPYVEKTENLDPEYKDIYYSCLEVYNELYSHRVREE
jgi:hypothetical protein